MRTGSSHCGRLTTGSRPGGVRRTGVGLTGRSRLARPRNSLGPTRRISAVSPASRRETLPSNGTKLRSRPRLRLTYIAAGTTTGGSGYKGLSLSRRVAGGGLETMNWRYPKRNSLLLTFRLLIDFEGFLSAFFNTNEASPQDWPHLWV